MSLLAQGILGLKRGPSSSGPSFIMATSLGSSKKHQRNAFRSAALFLNRPSSIALKDFFVGVSAFAVGRDGGVGGGASQDCFVGERALAAV